jgi:hypothetical protein
MLSTYTTFSKAESSGHEPQALNSICLANSADRLIGLLSIGLVGRAGVAPATQLAAVLQTVAHTGRRADL